MKAERTRVTLTLAADGSFVLDVANDPMWLLLRLETFAGGAAPANMSPADRDARLAQLASVFADRIVLFVDAHEVRATRVEYVAPVRDQGSGIGDQGGALARFHLEGTMPRDATRLRWLYGLVGDRYPLEIRQPDGSSAIEWIDGTNWSDVIDLSHSFTRPTRMEIVRQYLWLGYTHILPKGLDHILFVIGLFLLSPRLKTLLLQVTAFTVAHSITLGLSMYGIVSLPAARGRTADRTVDCLRRDRESVDARIEAVARRARVHVRIAARIGLRERLARARTAARRVPHGASDVQRGCGNRPAHHHRGGVARGRRIHGAAVVPEGDRGAGFRRHRL
jgi:hypothetical protein